MTPGQAAAIQSASSLLGTFMDLGSNVLTNRANRKWNEKMYGRQREDALADWQRQNAYNHPSEQMKRLREAGLNPNLVYDNGATTTGATVRSADVKPWNPEAPKFNINQGAALATYYDTQVKQAQTDNLRAQNTVLLQDAELKKAQEVGQQASTLKTLQDTKTSQFDLGQKDRLKDMVFDQALWNLERTRAETQSTTDENIRRQQMQPKSLEKITEEILTQRLNRSKTRSEINHIKATIDNLRKDERLKQLDIELQEKGFQKTDPWYYRVGARIAEAALNRKTFNIDRLLKPGRSKAGDKYVEQMNK